MSSKTIVAMLISLALLTTATMLFSTTGEAASSSPIAIDGNADLDEQADAFGWPGDGSPENPYLIADLTIDAPGSAGISIQNTDRHVIIRNCMVSGATWGGPDYGRGLWLSGTRNVTVEMSTFDRNDYGIFVQSSNDITLRNNVVTSSKFVGIWVETTRGSIISDCNIVTSYGSEAVYMMGSTHCDFIHNTVTGAGTGVFMMSSNNILVGDNVLSAEGYGVHVWDSDDITISDNDLIGGNFGFLISLFDSDRCTISDNTIEAETEEEMEILGISISGASDFSIVTGNEIFSAAEGIRVYYPASHTTVSNNIVNSSASGICLEGVSFVTAANNTIEDCPEGIHVDSCRDLVLADNIVVNASVGIYLQDTNDAYVASNYVLSTSLVGILVEDSFFNIIDGNLIAVSGECGIMVIYSLPMAPMIGPGTSAEFSGNAIINNNIEGEAYSGIALLGIDDNRVLNNTVSGCIEGISIYGSSWNVIEDNDIDLVDSGIVLYMADGCTVRSNIITNATEIGIWLELGNDNLVEDNRISGPQTYGILLGEGKEEMKAAPGTDDDYGLSYNVVSGNVIEGGQLGLVLYQCSDITVTENHISGTEYDAIVLNDVLGTTISGNTIIGDGGDGIDLGHCYECVIKGNLIDGCYYGVEAWSSELNLIAGNTICAEEYGIYLYLADYNRIYDNSIEAMGAGIGLDSSISDLQGNAMTGCAIMMWFSEVYDEEDFTAQMIILENNTVNGLPVLFLHDVDMGGDSPGIGWGEIILLNVSRFNVVGQDLADAGVIIAFSDNIAIMRNMITNACVGISVYRSVDCGFHENTIAFYPDSQSYEFVIGIDMVQSERISVLDNHIRLNVDQPGVSEVCWYGIEMFECSDCDVIDNIISVRGSAATSLYFYGIFLSEATNSYVSQNIITDEATFPHDGIGLGIIYGNSGNGFFRNVIIGMPNEGVYVFGSNYNEFFGNDISFSGSYGIYVKASYDNSFYGNRLTGNNGVDEGSGSSQAYDNDRNWWSGPSYGNIWSDWTAPDGDHNGIVDLPYAIDGGAFDNKPVVVYLDVTSPAGSPSYTNLSSLTLEGTALDVIGIYQVSWRNVNTGESGNCTGTTAWSATIPLAVGNNRIVITLIDLADLDFEVEVVVVYTTGPVISVTPGPTDYTNEADFQAEVEVSDLAPLTGGNWTHYLDGVEVAHGAFEGIAGLFDYSAIFAPALRTGTNLFAIQMNDTAGASAIYRLTVVYDVATPTLYLDAPTEDLFNADSVTVEWHAEDALSGIDRFELRLDGGEWSTYHGNSYTFADLADGLHIVTVRVFDRAGNFAELTVSFTIDTISPSVVIAGPIDGSFNNTGSVTVSWTTSDVTSGIKIVQYSTDGTTWIDAYGAEYYIWSGLVDGTYTFYVRAWDNAGNVATEEVSFIIDTVAPDVVITAPEADSLLTTTSATATWLATDAASDLGSVFVRIDEGTWHDALGMSQWIFSELADGLHTIEVRAVDRAGNEAVESVTFTVDTIAPFSEASADGVAGTSGWFLGDVTVTLQATDATSGVRDLEYRLNGGAWTIYANPIALTDEGVFTIEYRATDVAGNVEAIRTITVSIDRTAPEAEILSPTEGELLGPGSYVTWTASDGVSGLLGFEYRVDEGAWTSSSTQSFDLKDLADGLHTFALRAIDVAGNIAELSVSFTIDTTAPTVVNKSPEGDGVDLDAEITVEFSEAIDQSSVEMLAGTAGTIIWEGNTLTFVPTAKRSAGTTYTVVINGRDLAGNEFNVTWSFKTTDLGGLSGTVIGPNGQPVAGAVVTLSNGMNATTDSQGKFSFADVTEGSYTLSIVKEGFEDATQEVTVVAGETSPVGALSLRMVEPESPSGNLDPVLIGGIVAAIVAALAIALMVMRGRKK